MLKRAPALLAGLALVAAGCPGTSTSGAPPTFPVSDEPDSQSTADTGLPAVEDIVTPQDVPAPEDIATIEDTGPTDSGPAIDIPEAQDIPDTIDDVVDAQVEEVDIADVTDAVDAAVETDPGPATPPEICVGVSPPESAWETEPGPQKPPEEEPTDADASGTDAAEPPPKVKPVVGQPPADFVLTDFQPQSCGYGGTYGLDVFKGHVTVVVLLAGW